jgi:outer membrane protein TolC
MEETRILVRQGARAPGELKAAEYGVRVREESLVLAYLALEERSLELRHVVGLETGPAGNASLPLWPGDRGDARAARPPVGAAVARGLERNPALALLALGEESADLDVRVARDGLRPRLDLSLSAGVGGDAPTVDGAVSSLGDQPADLFAGLTFSIELGRNTAQGASTSAAARKRKLRIELEEQRRRIGGSIVVAVHRVEAAQTRIQVTAQAVELALANLDTERARFRAGKTTSFEVLQRQDELDRARLSRARAASDHHQALVTLGALTGDLLEQYGVAVIE